MFRSFTNTQLLITTGSCGPFVTHAITYILSSFCCASLCCASLCRASLAAAAVPAAAACAQGGERVQVPVRHQRRGAAAQQGVSAHLQPAPVHGVSSQARGAVRGARCEEGGHGQQWGQEVGMVEFWMEGG